MNLHTFKSKRVLITSLLFVSIFCVSVFSSVYADTVQPAGGSQGVAPAGGSQGQTTGSSDSSGKVTTLTNPLKGVNSISDLIFTFMKFVSYIAVIFGVLMLMWVGLQFVLAQGNPEEIKKRSNQLLWVIVGIGIILGARILVSVIINTLQSAGADSAVIQNAQNVINRQ